ncbi:hypothetical protein KY331_01400 [Candidatus Woesearchaeota archaeon]|nr:hypothetical protein [Candidatus Woesearchaeota archaeon]
MDPTKGPIPPQRTPWPIPVHPEVVTEAEKRTLTNRIIQVETTNINGLSTYVHASCSELRASHEQMDEDLAKIEVSVKKHAEFVDERDKTSEQAFREMNKKVDELMIGCSEQMRRLDDLESFPSRGQKILPETPLTSDEELEEIGPREERRRCWLSEWLCNIWEAIKECFSSLWS